MTIRHQDELSTTFCFWVSEPRQRIMFENDFFSRFRQPIASHMTISCILIFCIFQPQVRIWEITLYSSPYVLYGSPYFWNYNINILAPEQTFYDLLFSSILWVSKFISWSKKTSQSFLSAKKKKKKHFKICIYHLWFQT